MWQCHAAVYQQHPFVLWACNCEGCTLNQMSAGIVQGGLWFWEHSLLTLHLVTAEYVVLMLARLSPLWFA